MEKQEILDAYKTVHHALNYSMVRPQVKLALIALLEQALLSVKEPEAKPDEKPA